MKITHVEIWKQVMPLKVPYTIAYDTYSSVTAVFIRIETDSGLSGFGTAAPDFHVTGETPESVFACLENSIKPFLLHKEALRYLYLADKIKKLIPKNRAARAAVDMALYDVLGKYARLPVWKLLGGFRKRIATSLTIGILPLNETLEMAEKYIKLGARILKLKGGISLDEDLEKLYKIREKFGNSIRLRFDANQGFSELDSFQFVKAIEEISIELLEQPVPIGNSVMMGNISRKSTTPIMADESILGLTDAFHLVRHNLIDMINIKLMKTGGLTDAIHINSVGRAAGVEVMVGCMDESALGIAAGLHLALSRPNIIYADLDGHFDVEDDPAENLLEFRKGYLYPNAGYGFGWNGP